MTLSFLGKKLPKKRSVICWLMPQNRTQSEEDHSYYNIRKLVTRNRRNTKLYLRIMSPNAIIK